MAKQQTFEMCRIHLYDDETKLLHLATEQRNRLKRIRSAYTLWNDYPNKKPREIIDHLIHFFEVEKSQAYEDVRIIQELLGEINKASKDWHRFKFNNMVHKAFEIAELKQDADAMQKAANTYAKFNQLDKEEVTAVPWEDIIPQLFEPSEDPTLLGIKPIKNIRERIDYLKNKFNQDIQDVTYEDIDIQQLEKYATE